MKFSIRGLFSFEFSLAIPHFWRQDRARIAADYELERFFIAGFQYHDGPELVEELEAGTELVLIHEKDNPHDPRAVAFHFGSSHLGYIPRQRNRTIAALLDQGAPLRAHITQVDSEADPWHAVEVAVFMITGTPSQRRARIRSPCSSSFEVRNRLAGAHAPLAPLSVPKARILRNRLCVSTAEIGRPSSSATARCVKVPKHLQQNATAPVFYPAETEDAVVAVSALESLAGWLKQKRSPRWTTPETASVCRTDARKARGVEEAIGPACRHAAVVSGSGWIRYPESQVQQLWTRRI